MSVHLPGALGKQVGPFPLGVWIAVVGGGLFIGMRRRSSGQPDATGGTAGTDATPAADPSADPALASPDGAVPVWSPTIQLPELPSAPPAELPPAPVTPTTPAPPVAGTPAGPPPPQTRPIPGTTPPPGGGRGPLPRPGRPGAMGSPAPRPPAGRNVPARRAGGGRVTVRPGDTLSAIGRRTGVPWQQLYALNRSVIEAAARTRGRRSSDGGHWIYPGTVLTVPGR